MENIPEYVRQMLRDTQRARTFEMEHFGRRTVRGKAYYLFYCPICRCEIKSVHKYKGNVNVINHLKTVKHQRLCWERSRDYEALGQQDEGEDPLPVDLLNPRRIQARRSYWFDRPNPVEPDAPGAPVEDDDEPPQRRRRLNQNQNQQPQQAEFVPPAGPEGDRAEVVAEGGAQHENQNRDDDIDRDDNDNQQDLDEGDDGDAEEGGDDQENQVGNIEDDEDDENQRGRAPVDGENQLEGHEFQLD